MTWQDTHAMLRARAESAPQLVREAAALAIPPLPFDPGAVRAFVTTGLGSSAAAAKLLAHVLSVELALPARFAPAGAFTAAPAGVERDVLIVFSTGLSPNARLALGDPGAWRNVVVVSALAPGDDAAADKLAALTAVARAGGVCVRQPGGTEYGALLRVAAPIAAYAVALRLADAIAAGAGVAAARPRLDPERVCAQMTAARAAAASIGADDPFRGRVALLASGGYGELADNLSLKIQEGLLAPQPPVWDLIGFAHGPFQEVGDAPRTLLMLQRRDAPLEAELLARLRSILQPRDRLLLLPASLPGPLALFEHEAILTELVLGAIAARRIDQTWSADSGRDRPLYEVAAPAPSRTTPHRRSTGPPAASSQGSERALTDLAWPEFEALVAKGCRTAVIPLGATEQHGPHLPFATDTWIAAALAERFCARVAEAVHLPVVPIGCSSEHGAFPGTLSLRADTLRALLLDILAPLSRHGFDTAFIFSAHGGNYAALREALPALQAAARPLHVIAFTDLDRAAAIWQDAGAAAGIAAGAVGHHAGEYETSILLALRPQAVRGEQLAAGLTDTGTDPQAIFYPSLRTHSASGVVGDPRAASALRAEAYLAAWVDALVDWYRREKNVQYTTGVQNA